MGSQQGAGTVHIGRHAPSVGVEEGGVGLGLSLALQDGVLDAAGRLGVESGGNDGLGGDDGGGVSHRGGVGVDGGGVDDAPEKGRSDNVVVGQELGISLGLDGGDGEKSGSESLHLVLRVFGGVVTSSDLLQRMTPM